MEIENNSKRMATYVLCIVLLLNLVFPTASFAEEQEVVKVGWFVQKGYQELNDNGEPYGSNYEYLTQIAQYTDWQYEFVITSSFAECYDMLKRGEIDMMGYTLYSEQRATEVLYPEQNCGYVGNSIFVRNDSPIAAYDFEALDGIKIACMESKNPEYLKKYAEDNGFTPHLVYYGNNAAVSRAVIDKKVDGGLCAGYQPSSETRIVANFEPKPFYFVVNKSKPELLEKLNKGLDSIRLDTPFFDSALAYKYLPESKEKLNLTKAELMYIEENPVMEVAYYVNWPPVSVAAEGSGAFTGISADVFDRIAKITGLEFKYTPVAWGSEEAKKAPIIASMVWDETDNYDKGHRMSDAYLNVPLVLITKRNGAEDDIKTTAVPRQLYVSHECESVSGTEILNLENIDDCLEAVMSGKADQALISSFAVEYFNMKSTYNKVLKETFLYNESYGVCVGIGDGEDLLLNSIFNKALDLVTASDINAIIYNNITHNEKITIGTFIQQLSPNMIILSITVLVSILALLVFLLSRQVKYSRRIKNILYTDELTGCMSHKGFVVRAPEVIKKTTGVKIFIIDFDINHFGNYNVINGYQRGNEILCIIGQLAKERVVSGEIFARVQADHFLGLAFGEDINDIINRIKEGRRAFRALSGGGSLRISYGIYQVEDKDIDIVSMCEGALAAKRTIKGSYEKYIAVYDEEVHKKQLKNTELLEGFEQAVKENSFVHYFQPKYDINTQMVVGAEALVRWVTEEKTIIMPEKFIDLFESNGLISKLDLHMFEVLCKKISQVLARKGTAVPISINFSRVHLFETDFVEKLEDMIKKYHIPAALIEVEITETAFAESLEVMRGAIDKLHKVGFSVSIDDFGSGFSSLNTLKDVEFDIVKLDRGFLSTAGGTERGEKVISNIITLAHDLKLRIVAEGVENEEQYQMLRRYGCDMVQGFYFSKPLAEAEFDRLVLNQKIEL